MSKNNLYLLLGPEERQKKTFIKETLGKVAKTIGSKPEIHRFYSFESNIQDIISLLRNNSLFSSHKAVIIYAIEELKQNDISSLVEYCKKPAKDTTLFLLSDKIKINNLFNKIVPTQQKMIFWELFENQKKGWIKHYLGQNQMSIEEDAIELLLEMVENTTANIKSELDKLIVYLENTNIITADHVETHIFHSKEENAFTLFAKIAKKDFNGSLETLRQVLLSNPTAGIQLLAGLRWQFKNLHTFLLLVQHQYKPDEAFSKIKITSKHAKNLYRTAARYFSNGEIQNIFIRFPRLDKEIRSARNEVQRMLLEIFIYNICKGSV